MVLTGGLIGSAHAADCGASSMSTPGLHDAEATPFEFQFESGASWELCWHIDDQAGLVISRVSYGTPAMQPVQVLDAASIGQLIFKYDEDTDASHLLSEPGLGGRQRISPAEIDCTDGDSIVSAEGQQICLRFRDKNHLTKVRNRESIRRHEISLHAYSRIGAHHFEQRWSLSEDGELNPSVIFSGHIDRFTTDKRYGVRHGNTALFAASATLLVNWRLDFNISGTPDNDLVDEIEFVPSVTDVVKRAISVTPLTTETSRTINSEHFRGWRISDAEVSSGDANNTTPTTRVGYFLDPQGAGYRYVSDAMPWTKYDFFITGRRDCEKFSSANSLVEPSCTEDLSDFVDGEALDGIDKVIWFSVSRHFLPSAEDNPAIAAREIGFSLIPFDWSAYSPFQQPGESASYGPAQ